MEKHEQSLMKLQTSIQNLDFRVVDDRAKAAEIRVEISRLLISLQRYNSATYLAKLGFEGLQKYGGSDALKATALQSLGLASWFLHGPASAVDPFEKCQSITSQNQALPFPQRIRGEDNLALAFHELGEIDLANCHQETALKLAIEEGDIETIARVTRRRANLLQDRGYFDLAHTLLKSIKPKPEASLKDQVAWFSSSAQLAEKRGYILEAKEIYQNGLPIFREMTDSRADMASFLSNAALLYVQIGELDRANDILAEYEDLVVDGGTLNARLGILRLRANMAFEEDEPEQAATHWQQAAQLIEADGDGNPLKLASISTIRARLSWNMDQQKQALDLLSPYILSHNREAKVRGREEYRLEPTICLAQYLLDLGQTTKASELLGTAFEIDVGIQHFDEEWRLLSAFADLATSQGNTPAAILLGKLAVRSISQLSNSLKASQKEYEAFLKSKLKPFQNLIEHLIEDVRYPEAVAILAMTKFEQIFDFVRRDTGLNYKTDSVPLRHDEEKLIASYDQHRKEAQKLRNQTMDWRKSKKEKEGAARNLVKSEIGSGQLLANIFSNNWLSKNDTEPPLTLPYTPDEGIAALHFFESNDTVILHVLTVCGNAPYTVFENATVLSKQVFALRQAIQSRAKDYRSLAKELYENLIGPAQKQLEGIKRLEIMATGALANLPFACLVGNNRFLIEDFVISYRTGIKCPEKIIGNKTALQVSAFGAVYHNEHSAPLPHVEAELANIKALSPSASIYSNRKFTAKNIGTSLKDGATVMHIASHFRLMPAASHRSYLLLGDGTSLSLEELRNKKYDFSNLQLLVLSGCETGTAEQGVNGVESLAGLAHLKGVRDVIGTLWPIADSGAAAIMRGFYEAFLSQGKGRNRDPGDCLRHAQKLLISGNEIRADAQTPNRGIGIAVKPAPLSHPFFWAGFSHFVADG